MYKFENMTQSQSITKIGTGKAFGTFGELLQGVMSKCDLDFLVTFPITCFAHATFISDPSRSDVEVSPSFKSKSKKVAELLLQEFGLHRGGKLVIESDIPVGKGLASSSADLVATARAISACFHLSLTEEQMENVIRQIEPSDGVMYSGVVSFYHKRVQLKEYIGDLPPLTVVSIDEGGQMDTIQFNKIPKPFSTKEKKEFDVLLDMITKAIREQDVEMIGEVATQSAILNQMLRPKKCLHDMIRICNEVGGLGIIATHSGTCLGILLSPNDQGYQQKLLICQEKLQQLQGHVGIYYSWNGTGAL
ncbi:kinase [Thermoflavimicrobium daqui]|jgi:L-threonine kinase|uniref:Kinase n=1 Tax=Thermoflavimicrobium daqui TaxID=2137476 RepID=A0A364K4Y6_9BACL|nr:kinase [Thermoflavimicrobium daqui]RAL24448.1 kinase [Thermoflavimicrobium daqui]